MCIRIVRVPVGRSDRCEVDVDTDVLGVGDEILLGSDDGRKGSCGIALVGRSNGDLVSCASNVGICDTGTIGEDEGHGQFFTGVIIGEPVDSDGCTSNRDGKVGGQSIGKEKGRSQDKMEDHGLD